MPRIQVLSGWERKWWEKGAILCDFCPIPVAPRWLTVSELKQSWYVSSLLMGDYYCGVNYHSFGLRRQKPFLGPKPCLNYATIAIMLHQSNHQYFLMNLCSHRKVRCSIVMKDHRFWELQLVVLWFSHVSIDFHPKKVIEFTTTAAVF